MNDLTVLAVILGGVAVIALFGLNERRRYLRALESSVRKRFGKLNEKTVAPERLESIRGYYKKHCAETSIDDITWTDLELDRLFSAMNMTYSSAGEELLYHTLRTPLFDEEELRKRNSEIQYFSEHEKERTEAAFIFAQMGKLERFSLYDYLDFAEGLKEKKLLPYHFLAPLFVLLAALLLLLDTKTGILLLILAVSVNVFWYYRTKGQIQPYLISLSYVLRDIGAAKKLRGLSLPAAKEKQEEITRALKELKGFASGAVLANAGGDNGDPLSVIVVYVNMIFHLDIMGFYRMYRQMQQHKEDIDRLHGALGYFEMLIAVAGWRKAMGEGCTPVFDGRAGAKDIRHPMIEEPVTNSYELKGCMLLTGSNASGKSTFLKTVAVNMLLSQTIYFACAGEFHTELSRIYTSMALRDDMQHKESYFIVELKAMQRILQASATGGTHITCFVDEVLRGTNTVERIAASTQILRFMKENNIRCYAATHDIELTELLADDYENYHFEEEIADGDVLFNYRLQEGRARTRNAIKLLSVMGYAQGIVQQAEKLAEEFTRTGAWRTGNEEKAR